MFNQFKFNPLFLCEHRVR